MVKINLTQLELEQQAFNWLSPQGRFPLSRRQEIQKEKRAAFIAERDKKRAEAKKRKAS